MYCFFPGPRGSPGPAGDECDADCVEQEMTGSNEKACKRPEPIGMPGPSGSPGQPGSPGISGSDLERSEFSCFNLVQFFIPYFGNFHY